jgi:nucleoid-associated protein YgaU
MALGKLMITPLSPSGLPPISVLFNPNSYTITKLVAWGPPREAGAAAATTPAESRRNLNAPPLVFGGGQARQLTLELFFDVTESGSPGLSGDVRSRTDQLVKLTRIEPKHGRPPTCRVEWGRGVTEDFPFEGVVNNLTERFTLFAPDGTPLRATLTVVFVEFLKSEDDLRKTDPERTTRVVMRGDTLSSIAADAYRDPTRWRPIAEANQIDDPRHLEIGRVLTIPALG